ncbi:MAG TPA: alpha/beta fold hydrolase [Desulfomonilia bacterium]|nr:alpha/beta fold hydrolase [Desulfomonilia bacterium]
MSAESGFIPPRYLQGPYTQTILASAKIRAAGRNPMRDAACEMIINAGDGVRLQGFFSPQSERVPLGLVIMLHGWEGSAGSTYVLHAGRYFYELGYNVFRLNFRDHGDTHHLNEGVFYAILLDEVFNAVAKASNLPGGERTFLMGFSLGGNFALRIGRKCSEHPIMTLRHIVAISPVLDPSRATDAIDRSPLLRWYFLKKWRRSLALNQELYPHLYDFRGIMELETLRAVTDALLKKYTIFKDSEEYFRGYAVTKDALKSLSIPTSIVASSDDPAIPADEFPHLVLHPSTRLFMHTFGGHNGFLYGVFKPTWYEKYATGVFAASLSLSNMV